VRLLIGARRDTLADCFLNRNKIAAPEQPEPEGGLKTKVCRYFFARRGTGLAGSKWMSFTPLALSSFAPDGRPLAFSK
jgi:hypothetical protein